MTCPYVHHVQVVWLARDLHALSWHCCWPVVCAISTPPCIQIWQNMQPWPTFGAVGAELFMAASGGSAAPGPTENSQWAWHCASCM